MKRRGYGVWFIAVLVVGFLFGALYGPLAQAPAPERHSAAPMPSGLSVGGTPLVASGETLGDQWYALETRAPAVRRGLPAEPTVLCCAKAAPTADGGTRVAYVDHTP